jgi:hypothetical protein
MSRENHVWEKIYAAVLSLCGEDIFEERLENVTILPLDVYIPPWGRYTNTSSPCRIDFPRLLSQWILVVVVTGGLLYTLKAKTKD